MEQLVGPIDPTGFSHYAQNDRREVLRMTDERYVPQDDRREVLAMAG
jgi:hypothetical protein